MIVLGAILTTAGFVAKIQAASVPDWLACGSLTVGLATIIFASGCRSAGTLRK